MKIKIEYNNSPILQSGSSSKKKSIKTLLNKIPVIGGIIYNRLLLKRKYPQTWK